MEDRVATRYARALLNAASKDGAVTEAGQDLDVITTLLAQREDFKEQFESPKIPRERKLALLDKLFADRARPVTLRLMRLLVVKGRTDTLSFIYKEFLRLKRELEGVLEVEISSAVPLTDSETQAIISKLEKQTGKRIVSKTMVEPLLIGGVAVRYGDYVLDGTVRAGLRRLKEKLFLDVLKQT